MCWVAHPRSDADDSADVSRDYGPKAEWEIVMRKILYALASIALLAEPTLAMPVSPTPVAPVVSNGQIVTVAHVHRAVRRAARRVDRRH